MKLLKNIIFLIPILIIGCSQQDIVLSEDDIPGDIFYLKDDIKPYTGKCLVYYHKTELIKEEFNFKNGLLNGEHLSYFKNGSIKRSGYYLDGNLHGTWRMFDEKGDKVYEVNYENDILIGLFISWYSTGVIKQKGKYKNNCMTGEWVSFDEAGMILKKVIL